MKSIAKTCCCTLAALAALFGMAAISAQGASFTNSIPLLPGEVWWGGGCGDGHNQPYGAKDSRRINLRRNGNTSSPLLVSSRWTVSRATSASDSAVKMAAEEFATSSNFYFLRTLARISGIMCGNETDNHRYAQCKPLADFASEVLTPFAWRSRISQLEGDINEKTGQTVDVQGKGWGVPQPTGNRTA